MAEINKFILPIRLPSRYLEMIRKMIPTNVDGDSFRQQVARMWQNNRDAEGRVVRDSDKEFIVYVSVSFLLWVYDVLARKPQCHTTWLNPELKTRLTAQLQDPAIVPVLMEINKVGMEEAVGQLLALDAAIKAQEQTYIEEQNEIAQAGYDEGLDTVVIDGNLPFLPKEPEA